MTLSGHFQRHITPQNSATRSVSKKLKTLVPKFGLSECTFKQVPVSFKVVPGLLASCTGTYVNTMMAHTLANCVLMSKI